MTERMDATNNTYKKLAVQWSNEHLFFVSSSVKAVSFSPPPCLSSTMERAMRGHGYMSSQATVSSQNEGQDLERHGGSKELKQ